MSFNPNIKNHLSNFDGLTQKGGISGIHNLYSFNQAAATNGVKVLSETPTSVAGITTVRYQIPAYDRAGNIDKFSGQPTSTMTVLTDRFGNLITTTPGVIK